MNRRKVIKFIALAAGLLLISAAVFALQIGLDNDPGWGRGRIALLGLGLVCWAWAAWDRVEPAAAPKIEKAAGWLGSRPPMSWLTRINDRLSGVFLFDTLRPGWISRTTVLGGAIALLAYLWLFTSGTMVDWPQGSRYFDRLGDAFRAGSLALLEPPSEELLAAENPYYYVERGDIPVLWDSLFYEGEYYLYWGPVPGLIVAGLKAFFAGRVRDSFLLGMFMFGALAAGVSLVRAIWQRFEWLPRRMFFGVLLAVVMNAPLVWLLSRPRVYEAAIAGGQFFLLAGLFFAFTGLKHKDMSLIRLSLAGLMWALAAGTRINLSLSVAFLGLLVIWRIYRLARPRWAAFIRHSLIFGVPLLMGAVGLMAYNQARFGSPLDFGYRYLITGPTIPQDPSRTYSPDYAIPNLYQYFLRPLSLQESFPYIQVAWVKNDTWPFYIDLPPDYFYTEPVASILMAVPLITLGGLVLLRRGWLWLNGMMPARPARPDLPVEDKALFAWLKVGLAVSSLLALGVALVFINNSFRYIVDSAVTITLLACLLLAEWVLRLERRGWERSIWRAGWGVAALLTPVLAVLAAITGYDNMFEETNPELFNWLVDFFP